MADSPSALRAFRMRTGALVARGFFEGASKLGSLHPLARPRRHGVEVIKDVPYVEGGGHRSHRLDIYRPQGAYGLLPTVFYIHGGGFRILSKDTHWVMGLAFARKGYLVFNIEYRLAPRHPFPAAIDDVSRAFDWFARNGAHYGADLGRVALAGESAGANLASAVALSVAYRRDEPYARRIFDAGVLPRAVLPACGILQVSDVDRFARRKPGFPRFLAERLEEVESSYLGPDPGLHGESLDLADPLVWAERGDAPVRPLPPFFLPVGTRDPLLPDTRRFAQALRSLGATAEDHYYPGEVHAFHAFPFRARAQQCWRDTYAFLETHLAG